MNPLLQASFPRCIRTRLLAFGFGVLISAVTASASAAFNCWPTGGALVGSGKAFLAVKSDSNQVAESYAYTISWGDGTESSGSSSFGPVFYHTASVNYVRASHTYTAAMSGISISVQLSDGEGCSTNTFDVRVPPPEALITRGFLLTAATVGVPVLGEIAKFSDNYVPMNASGFTASINWGDGTVTAGEISYMLGNFSVLAPPGGHAYAGQGSFTVSATLTKNADATVTSTATGTVVVTAPSGPSGQLPIQPPTQPVSTGPQTTIAVEYVYDLWNSYFVTDLADEIAALDGGAFGGVWKRTGYTFNVWSDASGGALPTCRFFSTGFAPKSSHFYTPLATECAAVKTDPAWLYEGIAFYIQLADDNGLCATSTIPLYRLYNNGMGGAPDHRYTTSPLVLNQMLTAGWEFEGNGNTMVFACVPQ